MAQLEINNICWLTTQKIRNSKNRVIYPDFFNDTLIPLDE